MSARLRWLGPLALLLLVLLAPLLPRGPSAPVMRPAHVSGEVAHLTIVTPQLEVVRRKFSSAFSAWYLEKYHQAVAVEFLNFGGAGEIVNFFQSSDSLFEKSGTYGVDIVWGGGDNLFNTRLKKRGYLQAANLDPAVVAAAFPSADLNGVPLYDLDPKTGPQWFGAALSSFGIIYNKDLLRYLGLPEPRTWSDLADPRYRNWLVLADPTRSSSAKAALMTIVEYEMQTATREGRPESAGWTRGMGLIRQIAANAKSFASTANALPGMVSSGDAAAAMSIDFYARAQVAAMEPGRVGYVEPEGATIVTPEPIGIVTGARHPQVARRFLEFILSEPAQRLWLARADPGREAPNMALRRLAIRRSVYDHPEHFTEYTNPFLAAGGFNTRPQRTNSFGLIDELVALSCIELLEDLRETRKEILRSARAQELDARLGMFPLDRDAAQQALEAYGALSKGDPDKWLDLQYTWRELFTNEYRGLRKSAAAN